MLQVRVELKQGPINYGNRCHILPLTYDIKNMYSKIAFQLFKCFFLAWNPNKFPMLCRRRMWRQLKTVQKWLESEIRPVQKHLHSENVHCVLCKWLHITKIQWGFLKCSGKYTSSIYHFQQTPKAFPSSAFILSCLSDDDKLKLRKLHKIIYGTV